MYILVHFAIRYFQRPIVAEQVTCRKAGLCADIRSSLHQESRKMYARIHFHAFVQNHFIFSIERKFLYQNSFVGKSNGIVSLLCIVFCYQGNSALFGAKPVVQQRCPETNKMIVHRCIVKLQAITYVLNSGTVMSILFCFIDPSLNLVRILFR
ncbi:hypothetical protein SDC9_87404 [bioreactor metagenome]|uniref:Uncharacterized protein n=1 Tax=bioreactor metagenome TaxID=1076179 RepID=A0A644ZIS8_9ZZZZ